MTRDEIVRLAREAGFGPAVAWPECYAPFERFATLVAVAARIEGWKAARERAAKVCDEQHDKARTSPGAVRANACARRIRAMQPPAEWQCAEAPPVCRAAPNDELAFDDIERLRDALTWMGYATPESGEERAARWKGMVLDLIRAVLDKKRRAMAIIADAHAIPVSNMAEPWPHPDGFAGGLMERGDAWP